MAVATLGTWWSVAVAALVTVALLAQTAVLIFHYASARENGSAADAELLESAALVEPDTGLPTRRRWNADTARVYANDAADRGSIPVPVDWRGPDGRQRVLLVTTGPLDVERFREEALDEADPEGVGVLVIAPTLADRPLRFRLGDASEAVPHAESVLDETLDAFRSAGIHATGHVGPADPAVAVSDGLRTYDADLVVVARHRTGRTRHLETVPVDGAAAAFGVPLRELDLSLEATVH
jgi:nucleotide-binding universal stress UspA family protein